MLFLLDECLKVRCCLKSSTFRGIQREYEARKIPRLYTDSNKTQFRYSIEGGCDAFIFKAIFLLGVLGWSDIMKTKIV